MKTAAGRQIWKAKKDVHAMPTSYGKDKKPRRVVVDCGELIEFRYWSPATFRTHDELYLQVTEKEFYENFEFVGDIFHEVGFRNSNTTKQILDAKLYNENSCENDQPPK